MPAEKPTEPQNRENNNTRGYQQLKNEAQIDQVINVTLRGRGPSRPPYKDKSGYQ